VGLDLLLPSVRRTPCWEYVSDNIFLISLRKAKAVSNISMQHTLCYIFQIRFVDIRDCFGHQQLAREIRNPSFKDPLQTFSEFMIYASDSDILSGALVEDLQQLMLRCIFSLMFEYSLEK